MMRQVPPHLQNGAKGQGHKRKRWGCTRPSLRLGGGLVPTSHWLILRVPVAQRKTEVVFAKTDSHLGPQLLAGGRILGAWLYWWRQEGVRRNLRSWRTGVHGRIGKWRHGARKSVIAVLVSGIARANKHTGPELCLCASQVFPRDMRL